MKDIPPSKTWTNDQAAKVYLPARRKYDEEIGQTTAVEAVGTIDCCRRPRHIKLIYYRRTLRGQKKEEMMHRFFPPPPSRDVANKPLSSPSYSFAYWSSLKFGFSSGWCLNYWKVRLSLEGSAGSL
ncbi:hypothetical protein OUZ56_002093 [Daphnia magna]|uniref:Uncharacterized protein n=1 Tax=Daphnia magna TaxID=35525 RepID=A0ABR0A4P4_9CRUS|nr:hypothetical protein OUZ56_002093 [Daphnia magna]